MKKLFCLSSAISLMAFFLTSCGGGRENKYKPPMANGPLIYRQACTSCHDSVNNTGPDLRNNELTITQVRKTVSNGKGDMPRFPFITGEALAELADFVVKMK